MAIGIIQLPLAIKNDQVILARLLIPREAVQQLILFFCIQAGQQLPDSWPDFA